MATFNFNPEATEFIPAVHLPHSVPIRVAPPPLWSKSSTKSSFNPRAMVFTPGSISSPSSKSEESTTISSLASETVESKAVSQEKHLFDRASRSLVCDTSSSVPRYPTLQRISSGDVPVARSDDNEDAYKAPLVVNGSGPASRLVMPLNPAAPIFVPSSTSSRPFKQVKSSLNSMAPDYVPNNFLTARARLSVMLSHSLTEGYVKNFLSLTAPHQPSPLTTIAVLDHPETADLVLEGRDLLAQSQNICRDCLWAPKLMLNPEAKPFIPRYGKFRPWAEEFVPKNHDSFRTVLRRKTLNSMAKKSTPIEDTTVSYQVSIRPLLEYGALLAVKTISFGHAVPLGPTQLRNPVLRQRLFVPFLFSVLPSNKAMKWNGRYLAAVQPARLVQSYLPAIALAEETPSLKAIFTQFQDDNTSGGLQPQTVVTLTSSKIVNQEFKTTTGPHLIDSCAYESRDSTVFGNGGLFQEEYYPEAGFEIYPRPASPSPDNWEREAIFPGDEVTVTERSKNYDKPPVFNCNMAIDGIPQHDARDFYRSPRRPKKFKSIFEKGFGPSDKQLAFNFGGWPQPATVDQEPIGHHLSFFGESVPCKSDTSPATSMSIIFSTPKSQMAPDAINTDIGRFITLSNAFLFIDPVIYQCDGTDVESLSMTGIQNHAVGRTWKFYSSYGTWQHETLGPDDDRPELDTLNQVHYPDSCAVLNGISSEFDQPTRDDFCGRALFLNEKAKLDRKTAMANRLEHRKMLREVWAFKPEQCMESNLRIAYTPESMLTEDVAPQKTDEHYLEPITLKFAARNDFLQMDKRSWAEIDEEDSNNEDDEWDYLYAHGIHYSSTSEQLSVKSDPDASLVVQSNDDDGTSSAPPTQTQGPLAADGLLNADALSDAQLLYLVENYSDNTSQEDATSDELLVELPFVSEPREHNVEQHAAVMTEGSPSVHYNSKFVYQKAQVLVDSGDEQSSDEDLFGMSFCEGHKTLNGHSPQEISSKDPSLKTSTEEPSSEEHSPSSEDFSPVPLPETQRLALDGLKIVSALATPTNKGKKVDIGSGFEGPKSIEKGKQREIDSPKDTPESIKKILNPQPGPRILLGIGSSSSIPEGQIFSAFKALSSPPKRIPRSPAIQDLAATFRECGKNENAWKHAKYLPEIFEVDEDQSDSNSVLQMKCSNSLMDMNKECRALYGLSGPSDKPFMEDYNHNHDHVDEEYDPKTPISKKKWKSRQAGIARMPLIHDVPSCPISTRSELTVDSSNSGIMMKSKSSSPLAIPTTLIQRPLRLTPSSTLMAGTSVYNGPLAPHQQHFESFNGLYDVPPLQYSENPYLDPQPVNDSIALAAASPDDMVMQRHTLILPSSEAKSSEDRSRLRTGSRTRRSRFMSWLFGRRERVFTGNQDNSEDKPKGFLKKIWNSLTGKK